MPTCWAPWMSSHSRSPTNTARSGGGSPTAASAARNASACGLPHGDLGGVDGAVDQLEQAVPREHRLVVRPRPQRVGQHADPDPPVAQPVSSGAGIGVGRRCAAPRPAGTPRARPWCDGDVDVDAGRGEDVVEVAGAVGSGARALPVPERGLGPRAAPRPASVGARRLVHRARTRATAPQVDAVPRGQRAAPVEDDRVHAVPVTPARVRPRPAVHGQRVSRGRRGPGRTPRRRPAPAPARRTCGP